MKKPAWTEKVEKGMWLIVSRSPTVMSAEMDDTFLGRDDSDAVRAASRYADYHWSHNKEAPGDTYADISTATRHVRKRKRAGRQEAGQAEGGGPSDTEHTGGQEPRVASPSGSEDVEGT